MLFSKPQGPQSPRDRAARTQRRFVGRSLQGITLLLGGLAIVNLMVDPFRCFPHTRRASWSAQSQLLGSRTAKAELAFAEPWEVAMVGSSRVEIGLDPQARCWRGRKVCNLGLTATSMREVRRVVERVTTNASLEEIILALDFSLFNEQRPCGADFRQSRFDPACGVVENRLEMLWGWRATEESWAIISGAARKPPRIRADGFYHRDPHSVTADRQRAAFELELLHFASWPQLYGDFRYTGASLDELAAALQVCRDRGVDVKIVILPVHALLLEVIQRVGLWPTLETWKRDVTRLVQQTWDASPGPSVYDFTSYQGACAERLPRGAAAMQWFWEASHFRAELGSLVVERVLEGGVDNEPNSDTDPLVPMRVLNVDNIDHQLAAIRADRQAFLKACEDDLDVARRAVGPSPKTPLAQWQP